MPRNKTVIIVLYFGKLPWFFDYFIHSLKFNSNFDFKVIIDDTFDKQVAENIFIVRKTLEEVKEIIQDKLKLPVRFENPVKLCDFRPAYGLIFSELIDSYDFWGHTDIDIIFGNIANFITSDVLDSYDIISVRPEYISGFFALYRNCPGINNLYNKSKDFRAVFLNEVYFGFDECGLLCDDLMQGISLSNIPSKIESITHLVKKKENSNIRVLFELYAVESVPGNLEWNNGGLYYKDEFEILLYHLISFKHHSLVKIPTWKNIPERFRIDQFAFSQ